MLARTAALKTPIGASRCVRALITIACCWSAWMGFIHVSPASQGVPGSNRVADGSLNACTFLSMDRAIAVGERGLILQSEDGGKTWAASPMRGHWTFYGVGFDPITDADGKRLGLLVGGWIDPVTGRSEGVVDRSEDEGRTWTRVSVPGLPRLMGLQNLGPRHWVAWGDWSDHWQSSFFETLDGGLTWSGRPTPIGHVRSASIDGEGNVVLIGRAGTVYRSSDGIEYQPLELGDPFHPLQFCRWNEHGWWLGGDSGQLFRSNNGKDWTEVHLPGNPSDQKLISLREIVASGNHLWIVGAPGSVVWTSEDGGRRWQVASTSQVSELSALHALNENVLIGCGAKGRILISRNSGQAWMDTHVSGERIACLTISSTHQTIPWDLLGYVVGEGRRRAAAVAIHDPTFHQAYGNRCEMRERLAEAGRQIGIESCELLPEFPISNLRNGIRATDMGYYQGTDLEKDELIRRLVLEIRSAKPDLLVMEDSMSKQPLDAAVAIATQHAVRLAASPNYRCWSDALGADLEAWNPQRILIRSRDSGGLYLAPTMLLQSSGMLLSEWTRPARLVMRFDQEDVVDISAKCSYRISNHKTTSIKHPLDGMFLDPSTALFEPKVIKRKASVLLAASNAPQRIAHLQQTRGMGLWVEGAWDEELRTILKDMPTELISDPLFTLAVDSRRMGNWHRWYTALNLLLERNPDGPMAELAYRELMTFHGSPEIFRMIEDQLAQVQSQTRGGDEGTPLDGSRASSPFASNRSIAVVGFDQGQRMTAIAKQRGTEAFSAWMSRWPDTWTVKRSDPEWAWLITSRFRTRELLRNVPSRDIRHAIHWPPAAYQLHSWSGILKQEQALYSGRPADVGLATIPQVQARPYLDGKLDEPFWSESMLIPFAAPWGDTPSTTRIRFARDDEFLFVGCEAMLLQSGPADPSKASMDSAALGPTSQRKRDALARERDHVRFRIDIDRDYATWFEFAWDELGETLDQCNDMTGWDPAWYIATHRTPKGWNSEIAIPLASILPKPRASNDENASPSTGEVITANVPNAASDLGTIDWAQQVWAISLVRERPNEPTEAIPVCDSDRWSRDRWLLIAPSEAILQPDLSEQPTTPPPVFRGAGR